MQISYDKKATRVQLGIHLAPTARTTAGHPAPARPTRRGRRSAQDHRFSSIGNGRPIPRPCQPLVCSISSLIIIGRLVRTITGHCSVKWLFVVLGNVRVTSNAVLSTTGISVSLIRYRPIYPQFTEGLSYPFDISFIPPIVCIDAYNSRIQVLRTSSWHHCGNFRSASKFSFLSRCLNYAPDPIYLGYLDKDEPLATPYSL